jgi:hypothetical protein
VNAPNTTPAPTIDDVEAAEIGVLAAAMSWRALRGLSPEARARMEEDLDKATADYERISRDFARRGR